MWCCALTQRCSVLRVVMHSGASIALIDAFINNYQVLPKSHETINITAALIFTKTAIKVINMILHN